MQRIGEHIIYIVLFFNFFFEYREKIENTIRNRKFIFLTNTIYRSTVNIKERLKN